MSAGRASTDMTGIHIGRWTVLSKAPNRPRIANTFWLCRCDCGTEREVIGTTLRNGVSVSCGCYRSEVSARRMERHGHAIGKTSPTYNSWAGAVQRCTNPNYANWANYGGRGIKICERWLDYENFLADMGERPEGTTLDRFPNNNGDYEKGNCRWATPKQQANNRRPKRKLMLHVHGIRIREV
jgi:hypothetical protein